MTNFDQPLPCIACGMQPEPACPGTDNTWQPSDAVMFDAGPGNYGSTVWDEMSATRSMAINVCDKCLVANSCRVAMVHTIRQPAEVTFGPWKAPGDGTQREE